MILLTPTLGSRNYFHPESPLLQMITWSTEGFRRYSPMFSRDFEPVAFAIPYHRNIPMDIYLHLSFLLLFPVDLVIPRYPEILSNVPRILCAYCLAVLATWISLRIISRTYRVSTHPQLIHVCHQSSKYHSIFRKSSGAYCSWILTCLHYG